MNDVMRVEDVLLSLSAVAKALGVSRPTVYKWLRAGMPSYSSYANMGRRYYVISEIKEWLREGKHEKGELD